MGGEDLHDPRDDRLGLQLDVHPEHLLCLSAADGEVAVGGNGRNRLGEVVVLLELGGLGGTGLDHLAPHHALLRVGLAHRAAHVGDVGDALSEDVARVLERLVVRGGVGRASPNGVGEGLEALLAGDLGASAALGLVGLVEVLEAGLDEAGLDLGAELVGELALLVDGLEDGRLALLELGVVGEAFLDLADLHLVEVAVRLLAVAGNERHRASVIDKLLDCKRLRWRNPGVLRRQFDYGHFGRESSVER